MARMLAETRTPVMGAASQSQGADYRNAPRRFIFVWSTRHNATRCHVVQRSYSSVQGKVVAVTVCGSHLDAHEVSLTPHPKLPMCEVCEEARK